MGQKENKCCGPDGVLIQGIPYNQKTLKQHWRFLVIRSDVHQFKVIILPLALKVFFIQKEVNGDNQKILLLVTVKILLR